MSTPIKVLESNYGATRWKTLALAGISQPQILNALASGEILRHGRGVYSLPRCAAHRVEILLQGADSACLTAAEERGFWVLTSPERPHAAANHGREMVGFVKHRGVLPLSDTDVVAQVLRCADELNALTVLTSAVRNKAVSLDNLRRRFRRRRDARIQGIISRIDPHAESALEVASRYHLENAGFTVTSQVYVKGVGRMDQCIDGVLALELMGKQFHLPAEAFNEDMRRLNAYTVRGYPVLRAGFAQVVHRPEEFIGMVRAALTAISINNLPGPAR